MEDRGRNPNFSYLFAGLEMTLLLAVVSMILGILLGLVIAAARLSRFSIIRTAAGLYVDVWRSTPFLAQILWVFFALPILTGFQDFGVCRGHNHAQLSRQCIPRGKCSGPASCPFRAANGMRRSRSA